MVLKVKFQLLIPLYGGKSMSSETTAVALQYRLQEWAAQIRECQDRPTGMSVADWCASHGITKANNLKPYDYFEFLLTEIPKHLDDTDRSFLDDLLPWSPSLPENCRKPGKNEVK